MTLVLAGGLVVTSLDPVELADGNVTIEDDRIVAVGGDRAGDDGVGGAEPPAATRLDVEGCLVIPGNVCAHHHLYSTLARGMPYALEPPRNFVEILRRIWWRLDRALDEDTIR